MFNIVANCVFCVAHWCWCWGPTEQCSVTGNEQFTAWSSAVAVGWWAAR